MENYEGSEKIHLFWRNFVGDLRTKLTPTYLVAPLVVDGSHVDGADGAHAEHEEEGQADVDDGGELIEVGFHLVLYIP